jgi:rhodanese-related sulfurtransferase
VWLLSGFGFGPKSFETVTVEEAARLREGGAQVVDVRETVEWRRGHIPGALHIPVHAVGRRGPAELDADRAVVLMCASGHRSTLAARTLSKLGFAEVYDVHGGMIAWRHKGLPVES